MDRLNKCGMKKNITQVTVTFFELLTLYSIEGRHLERSVMRANVQKYLNNPVPRGLMQ